MQHLTFRTEQMIRNRVRIEELNQKKNRTNEARKLPALELHRLTAVHAA